MRVVEKEFLPVILGADVGAYTLARSFHEEYGIKSLVLSRANRGYIANSDIIEHRVFPDLEQKEALISHLLNIAGEFPGRKLLPFGCGDWYVRALIEGRPQLEPVCILPYIGVELLDRLVLKDSLYEIFDELGINHPRTFVYSCGQENELKFDFDYPVIAKPADSAMYHYAEFEGKKKVFLMKSEDELRTMLSRLEGSGYTGRFLIQDYVPGDDTNMRVLTCYCDRSSRVRFAALGRTLLEEHGPQALGNPAAIVNEVNPEIVAEATRFLEYVGYVGFANFDIKFDSRDGKYKFFEINTRLGRSNYYVTGSGFNTVKQIVDEYVYGRPGGCAVADRVHLYTILPKGVLKKYVPDGDFKEQALKLWSEGRVSRALFYRADKNLKHNFYALAAYINQYRKFKRYC